MDNVMAQLLNSVDGVKKRADLGPPRWFLPLTVGILTFGFVWAGQEPPGVYADFDYLWASGAAVWHGLDPHAYVQEQIAAGRGLLTLQWPYFLVLVYLPALYLVLRPQARAGAASACRQTLPQIQADRDREPGRKG